MAEIANGLRPGGERVEVLVGWLDLDDATLGVGQWLGLGGAALALGLGKEAAIGHARAAIAQLGREQDCRLEGLAYNIEEAVEGRIEGGLGGCGARGADGAKIGNVLDDRVFSRHAAFNDCTHFGAGWMRSLVPATRFTRGSCGLPRLQNRETWGTHFRADRGLKDSEAKAPCILRSDSGASSHPMDEHPSSPQRRGPIAGGPGCPWGPREGPCSLRTYRRCRLLLSRVPPPQRRGPVAGDPGQWRGTLRLRSGQALHTTDVDLSLIPANEDLFVGALSAGTPAPGHPSWGWRDRKATAGPSTPLRSAQDDNAWAPRGMRIGSLCLTRPSDKARKTEPTDDCVSA